MSTRLHSIGNRLFIIVSVTSIAALLITIVVLAIYDFRLYRSVLVKDLSTQAELIGRASIPALQFDVIEVAHANLALLEVRPNIISAALYDETGRLVTSYINKETPQFTLPKDAA